MFKFLILLLLGMCSSCVSTKSNVIGRSAQERPEWVDSVSAAEKVPGQFFATYKKTGVIRPEVGVRQAEAEAQANSRQFVLERARDELIKLIPKDLQDDKPVLEGAIATALSKIIETSEIPTVVPVKSYLEEIATENEEKTGTKITYDIYVLLELPFDAVDTSMVTCAKQFSDSENVPVNRFGKSLLTIFQSEKQGS